MADRYFERVTELQKKVIASTLDIDVAQTEHESLEKTRTALISALGLIMEYENIFNELAENFDNALSDVAELVIRCNKN